MGVKELIHTLAGGFDEFLSVGHVNNKIKSPLIIAYSGEKARKQDDILMQNFRQMWKAARASHICRALRVNDEMQPLVAPRDGDDIYSAVDEMFCCGTDIFEDFHRLYVVAIYDSRDYETCEQFVKCYENDNTYFQEAFPGHTVSLVRIVVLSQRGDGASKKEIKQYLASENGTPARRGTFVFGDILYSHQHVKKDQIYDLVGKLIVLGCNHSGSANGPMDIFGLFGDGQVRTVAYIKRERPNVEMCTTIVKKYIDTMGDYFSSQTQLNLEDVKTKLEFVNGQNMLVEKIYSRLEERFPMSGLCLPMSDIGNGNENITWNAITYQDLCRRTMNSIEVFYDWYFAPVIQEAAGDGGTIYNEIDSILNENFSQLELMQFSDELIAEVQTWFEESEERRLLNDGMSAYAYIRTRIAKSIESAIKDCVIREMKDRRGSVKDISDMLQRIEADFHENVLSQDMSVVQYYSPKVAGYLQKADQEIASAVVREGHSVDKILDVICEQIKKMLESPIGKEFKLPFEAELHARTADNNGIVNDISHNITANNMDNHVFFDAAQSPSPICRIVLMNQKNPHDANLPTALFNNIKALFQKPSDYFIDNGNSNSVALLQIYSLSSFAMMSMV